MKRVFIIIFLLTTSFFVVAQNEWTLEDCIKYAVDNNIQIKQQDLQVKLSHKQLLQSKAALLPDLNASATNVYNSGRTLDPFTNEFVSDWVRSNNFYLSTNVTLFNGFQLLNAMKQSRYDKEVAKYNAERMRNDISLQVATSYLQILFNIEMLKTSGNQLSVTNEQVERSKKLLAAGTITKGDLLQMEAQAASEEMQVVNSENSLEMSYLTLMQMIELDSIDDFSIQQPEIDMPVSDLITLTPLEIYNMALADQPEIKSAEANVQSTELGMKISRAGYYPYLNFRGTYGSGYTGTPTEIVRADGYQMGNTQYITGAGDPIFSLNPINPVLEPREFNDQLERNENFSLGFYLTIPLFNKLQTKTAVDAAKINMLNSQYNLDNEKKVLFKAIQQAHADAKGAFKRYAAAQKSVDALKKSFDYTEQRFNVGMVNSVDYSDAKNKLTNAESELLQAKYEYIFRLKVLEFYMGKPLTLNN